MFSKTLEVRKFMGKNIIYEFQIEAIIYDLRGEKIEMNKWLQCLDWMQIYDKLGDCLNRCVDFNFNEVHNEEFQISNDIEIKLKILPLDNCYRNLFSLNKNDTIDKLLQIQVRKISLEKYKKEINVLKKLTNIKNEKSNHNEEENIEKQSIHEYDPLKVGNNNNSDNHIPYKPSKLKYEEGEGDTRRNLVETDPYSPQPLDDSMKIDMYLNCAESGRNLSSELSIETESEIPASPVKQRRKEENKTRASSSSRKKKRALSPSESPNKQAVEKNEYKSKRIKNQKDGEQNNTDLFGSDSDHEKDGNKRYNTRPHKQIKNYNDQTDDSDNKTKKLPSNKKKVIKKLSSKPDDTISKWLCKNKSDKNQPSSSKNTKSRTVERQVSKSKEFEQLLQSEAKLEEHKTKIFREFAMKQAIDESKYDPEELKTLNLHHYSTDKLLNTFDEFKSVLDELYEKNNKKYIPNILGERQLVIGTLVNPDDRLPMLRHLRNNYQDDFSADENTNLFMNIMLPEWILEIFMRDYKFKRDEALQKIVSQYELNLSKPENIAKMCDHFEEELKWRNKKK